MAILLQVQNLSKSFGTKKVLDNASFTVSKKQKIGVIGRNGAGKSTLFKIIMDQISADSGTVQILDHTRIGYLKQEDDFTETDTVLQYLIDHSSKESWVCAKMASNFELTEHEETHILSLSGGYQMRVKLCLMLLHEPNLLLLDEPTNYLDISTLLLLEKFLQTYAGAYLVISHDRQFLKNTCKQTLEIERGKTYLYPKDLESYLAFKDEKLKTAYQYNKKIQAKRAHLERFIERFGAKASKATQAQSRVKQLTRLNTIDIQTPLANVSIKIPKASTTPGLAFRIHELAIGYPQKVIASNMSFDIGKGQHFAVLGDNGQGKSTFLKTLAGILAPKDGRIKRTQRLSVAYYAQHITTKLPRELTIEQYLISKAPARHVPADIFKMASNFLFQEADLSKTISVLSGGEKARLYLAGLLLTPHDIYLFDEPTNHLDFETAEALAFALAESNATILFVSHDRTFNSILAKDILEVKNGTIKRFHGNYDDYIEKLKFETKLIDEIVEKRAPIETTDTRKNIEYEFRKVKQRELKEIELQITRLKEEQEQIMEKFLKNPHKPYISLRKRLKLIEQEMVELEHTWLETSEYI
jgi:ATP-binding cassette subfamily F protein 3